MNVENWLAYVLQKYERISNQGFTFQVSILLLKYNIVVNRVVFMNCKTIEGFLNKSMSS